MSSEDDCTFEVIMMKPDCEPKCTEIVAGAYLLDLRSLKKTFQVEVDSKKFSVTLCGSNRECPNEIGACEILQNGATPLASVESQHFNYDVTKDELTARGRYKQGRGEYNFSLALSLLNLLLCVKLYEMFKFY